MGREERRREGEERRRREGRGVGLGNSAHVAGLRKGESRAAAGVNLQNCKSLQNFSVLEAHTHTHTVIPWVQSSKEANVMSSEKELCIFLKKKKVISIGA